MQTAANPNTPQPFTLPALPPRPSDTPPAQGLPQWEAAWRIYWQAAGVHQNAANAARLSAGADTMKGKTLADAIFEAAKLVPKHDDERDATWANRVKKRAEALYAVLPP